MVVGFLWIFPTPLGPPPRASVPLYIYRYRVKTFSATHHILIRYLRIGVRRAVECCTWKKENRKVTSRAKVPSLRPIPEKVSTYMYAARNFWFKLRTSRYYYIISLPGKLFVEKKKTSKTNTTSFHTTLVVLLENHPVQTNIQFS